MQPIVVTAMGIISSIGNSVEENLYSLREGKPQISHLDNLHSTLRDNIKVGEVKLSNSELAKRLGIDHRAEYSRTALLGIWAAKEAIAGLSADEVKSLGFVSASTVGGMDKTEQFFYEYKTNVKARRHIYTHNIGENTRMIADYFGIEGMVTAVSTACSSSANAIMVGTNLLRTGRLSQVLVGGSDALCKFTINGFNSLMILSDDACKPFDRNRKGLNLGEGAAYLLIETEENAIRHGRTVLAVLSGWGNTNEAYHQTASSAEGDGAAAAMAKALDVASIAPHEIDYINAHGTATDNNDMSESVAIRRIFGNEVPDFSSTKAFTGHTLAAASSVEAVYSILSIRESVVFPNLNFNTPIEVTNLTPQTTLKHKPIRNVLSNSFGFGGNCSTLIFSKYEK